MGKLSSQNMDRVISEHFGYEAQDDIDGVVSTLTDDVEHDVVGAPNSQIAGKDNAREYYRGLFQNLKGESVKPLRRFYGEDFVVDETLWTGHIDGPALGAPTGEGHVSFRILHILEFRDDKISRENVWVDLATIMKQLGASHGTPAK